MEKRQSVNQREEPRSEKVVLKNEDCPCKRLHCERLGNCAACREHHLTVETRYKVACERKKRGKQVKVSQS